MIKNRNVNIITDENGKNIVIINDRRFKGLTKDDWVQIENYLKGYVTDCYEITETSEKIYIGTEFPDEYANSKSRIALKPGFSERVTRTFVTQLLKNVDFSCFMACFACIIPRHVL